MCVENEDSVMQLNNIYRYGGDGRSRSISSHRNERTYMYLLNKGEQQEHNLCIK